MKVGFGGGITVTATERWLAELRAGRCFGLGGSLGASVGNYSRWQLFNPAGSAITVVVRAMWVSSDADGRIILAQYDTALASTSGSGLNLLRGGAASVAALRYSQTGANLGLGQGELHVLANTPFQAAPEWIVELGAAEGILIETYGTNRALSSMYFWNEV